MEQFFSIIVCTYNPNERLFRRVIEAIAALEIPSNLKVEYCLVDNNSSLPIKELLYVKNFLKQFSTAKVITEERQGLSFARMAGVNATTAPIVAFFDDDNIPHSSYLVELKKLLEELPHVAIWGPGVVEVEFTDPVASWVQDYRYIFQEKVSKQIKYGCEEELKDYYPFGTGLIVSRMVLNIYQNAISDGVLTATDRKGNSLASAGDIQIVLTGVKAGVLVGTAPQLKMRHLIPAKRTKALYLKRLFFALHASTIPAVVECFPQKKHDFKDKIPSFPGFFFLLIRFFLKRAKMRQLIHLQFDVSAYVGSIYGSTKVVKGHVPWWINIWIKILRLQ
jgi:glycosyltransferase involved in cell wall biosynthesis